MTSNRYWVIKERGAKSVGLFIVEEIAALLNAEEIREDYLALESPNGVYSFDQAIRVGNAKWVKVSEVLSAAYADKPLVSVVLRDGETQTVLLAEQYRASDGPWQVALQTVENYVDQHLGKFATESTKEILVYFKSEKCPASMMTARLKIEEQTVKKGIIGSKDFCEETYPYKLDPSVPRRLETPEEFPSVVVGTKPPKYEPTWPLPPGFRSRTQRQQTGR